MAIEKQLLIPGKRYRSQSADGSKKEFVATPEIIETVFASGNGLIAAGYDIPIPFEHDLDVMLSLNGRKKIGSIVSDLHRNAGFVKKFVKNEDGSLSMFLDIPNKATEAKLGKEIKGASLCLKNEFIDTDVDRNQVWKMAPLHVALTNKPVIPGLRTFQQVPDSILLSIDDPEADPETDDVFGDGNKDSATTSNDSLLKELKEALKSKVNVELPEGTTELKLLEYLTLVFKNMPVMVSQESAKNQNEPPPAVDPKDKAELDDKLNKPPKGAKPVDGQPETGVWAMSQMTPEELQKMISNAVEAAVKPLRDENTMLLSRQSATVASGFRKRIEILEARGASKDVIEKRILPILNRKDDKGQMVLLSQADEASVDTLLSVMEETIAPLAGDYAQDDYLALSRQLVTTGSGQDSDELDEAWKEIKANLSE